MTVEMFVRTEFGLLGQLYVRGHVDRPPNARKLRTLLAMLLIHAGRSIPAETLIRELWTDGAPVSGPATLQTYILSLRKFLATALDLPVAVVAREVLVTVPGGYLLSDSAADVDIVRYHEHVSAGSSALAADDDRVAIEHLDAALEQWRGQAFEDVPVGPVLASKRREYEESRLVVTEYVVDAKLRLGMLIEVMRDLSSLIVEHPLHEGIHARYMHVLHVRGRRAQALQEYDLLRTRLVRELGLEPGTQVQRVHQAVLNADTTVCADGPSKRSVGIALPVPAWTGSMARHRA